MPFDPSGRFIPANAMVTQSPAQMQMRAMSQAQPSFQASLAMRPEQSAIARSPFMNASRYSQAINPGYVQPAPDPNPPQQAQPAPPPAPRPGTDIGPSEPGTRIATAPTYSGPQAYQTYGMSQLGAAAPQYHPMGGPSPTQMAGRGNAQSVSNYLQALGQANAAQSNYAMNQPGQLGAGPQGGFRGFGYNPGYGASYVPQGYLGPMGGGLSYQGNMAQTANNYNIGNYAQQGYYGQMGAPRLANTGGVTAGGTGGVAGQGQYAIPEPWRNIANSDQGTPGSLRANSGWGQYTAGTYNRPENGKQPGAYTPGAMYTDRPPEGTYDPNDGKNTSDIRAKENITPAQKELEEFMDALGVYSYEYKDKADGAGRYISPMAQEFEKSQLGRQAVEETPEGKKMVNYGRLAGVQTAALALLNHKYNALEQKFNEAMKTNLKSRKK